MSSSLRLSFFLPVYPRWPLTWISYFLTWYAPIFFRMAKRAFQGSTTHYVRGEGIGYIQFPNTEWNIGILEKEEPFLKAFSLCGGKSSIEVI